MFRNPARPSSRSASFLPMTFWLARRVRISLYSCGLTAYSATRIWLPISKRISAPSWSPLSTPHILLVSCRSSSGSIRLRRSNSEITCSNRWSRTSTASTRNTTEALLEAFADDPPLLSVVVLEIEIAHDSPAHELGLSFQGVGIEAPAGFRHLVLEDNAGIVKGNEIDLPSRRINGI